MASVRTNPRPLVFAERTQFQDVGMEHSAQRRQRHSGTARFGRRTRIRLDGHRRIVACGIHIPVRRRAAVRMVLLDGSARHARIVRTACDRGLPQGLYGCQGVERRGREDSVPPSVRRLRIQEQDVVAHRSRQRLRIFRPLRHQRLVAHLSSRGLRADQG